MIRRTTVWICGLLCLLSVASACHAGEPDPAAGYDHLINTTYLPPYFDQETFDNVWRIWPEPLRSQAEKSTPDERRQMAFDRYGLTGRPEAPTKPLQYVVDKKGNWTLNCFSCHGGEIDGKPLPGLPNNRFDFAGITDDIRLTKALLGKKMVATDYSSLVFPLGENKGTTNAVNFGVALISLRDADLNFVPGARFPRMLHHDMEPPPWWHFSRKDNLYIDGFAPKGHRALLQFTMVRENGAKSFREREDDFRDIYAYLNSLESPKYSGQIDPQKAEAGRIVFNKHCSECHGTYGENATYPQRMVAIDEIKTDRARLDALSPEHREVYGKSWFNEYGEKAGLIADPAGYVAPPLDGVWATAPYFHNGSVPTLWHVLHPEQRPQIWQWAGKQYDHQKMGITVTELSEIPVGLPAIDKREVFDTSRFGKSAAGHDFPNSLSEEEKDVVLEYLKTL
ncbi:cytochrome c [Bremerella cremea]|uniref:Cytochrome c n=1 Tax=Bremerella cremea TaxID=1031537 RepID=A0A368KTJ0_9BACT|nr:c-type cytochrome [Bremerella cremea]RCS49249.1 cytochrome c [Bremerella cremea]